jgi:hypothetical protein
MRPSQLYGPNPIYLLTSTQSTRPCCSKNCVPILHLSLQILSIDVKCRRAVTTTRNVPHVPILTYCRTTPAFGATSANWPAKLNLQALPIRGRGLRQHVPQFDMSSPVPTSCCLQQERPHRLCYIPANSTTLLHDA